MINSILRPVKGYLPAIGNVTIFREGQQKQATFRAIVLDWDKDNPEWSMKTSNGVRYHRATTLEVFNKAIQQNGSLPIMFNHITEGADADQLGIIHKVIDTTEGMIIEGMLNLSKKRVSEEIIPGFMKNVSLQVIANDYYEDTKNDTIYAKPSRALEVSFVPVNGREGAKLLDIAIKESLSGVSDIKSESNNMEMARKAVAFEEIQHLLMESDIGIAYKMVEGKLSDLDKEIDELKAKGMSDKDILMNITQKYGVSADELKDLYSEDITTANAGAATATKMHGVDEPKKEEGISNEKFAKFNGKDVFIMQKAKATQPGFIVVQYLDGGYTMEVKEDELTNLSNKYPKKETILDDMKDKEYESFINNTSDEELKEMLKK